MRKQVQLQGPRPTPLVVNKNYSTKMKKSRPPGPVIIYLKSPDVIHVRPEEFMGLVQKLTGKPSPAKSVSTSVPNSDSTSMMVAVDDDAMAKEGGAMVIRRQNQFGFNCNNGLDDVQQHKQKFENSVSAYPSFCVNIYTDWR